MHARLQARVHDRQVLVGQRHVDHQVGLDLLDQGDGLGDVVGVNLADLDRGLAAFRYRLAARDPARGEVNPLEDIAVHCALLRGDGSGSASADDEDTFQLNLPRVGWIRAEGR